jgi:co-chaperonin GroES (HSP10)
METDVMTTALKNLKILNDYIIIKPSQQPDEEVTDSGLLVAKNPGDPSLIYHYAKVVGIGDRVNDGSRIIGSTDKEQPVIPIHVGDVVYYAQKKASALAIVEDDYIYDPRKANYAYVKPEDIIAVVCEDEEILYANEPF